MSQIIKSGPFVPPIPASSTGQEGQGSQGSQTSKPHLAHESSQKNLVALIEEQATDNQSLSRLPKFKHF